VHSVNISDACQTIRAWNDVFNPTATQRTVPGDLQDGVLELKRFLEDAKGDGEPIAELQIAEHLLATRSALKWVMPYVVTAEAMQGSGRQTGYGQLGKKEAIQEGRPLHAGLLHFKGTTVSNGDLFDGRAKASCSSTTESLSS
jgi:hypothetical protein